MEFVNTLHHPIAVTVNGVEHTAAPGQVFDDGGDKDVRDAWKDNHGAREATDADVDAWEATQALTASGRDVRDDGRPSGTISSIDTPTHSDHARGLVRDNREVAQQPTLPVTGGGELQEQPDEKAAFDRNLDAEGKGGLSHDEFRALSGDEAPSVFDDLDEDELREYAAAADPPIDLGRSSSRDGILKKILDAERERGEEAQEDAEGEGTVTTGS